MQISQMAKRLSGQAMFQIAKDTAGKKDLIHFEIGDPNFETSYSIQHVAAVAMSSNKTHYAPSGGIDELKAAAQDVTQKSRGFRPTFEQLLVTPGANWQIYAALACSCNPGDEVIVPDPGFVFYYSICEMLGLKIVPVPLRPKKKFKLQADDVAVRITDKTKAIIINSPSNPTGALIDLQNTHEIYGIARENDIIVISDEIYARMIYSGKFCSPSLLDHCDSHTVIINGFSKSYAMTGWRLGVMTGPEWLIEKCRLLLETTQSCVNTFIQYAGMMALTMDQEEIVQMVQALWGRRDLITNGLRKIGIDCIDPEGAFYVWANVEMDGKEFYQKALEVGVVVCPGVYFGSQGERYVRLCFGSVGVESIREGLERLKTI